MSYTYRIAICIFSAWLSFAACCNGQSISITVKDSKKVLLTGTTIKLTKVSDSTFVYGTTDRKGVVLFDNTPIGLYIVKISYIGYKTLEKTINVKPEKRSFDFFLEESSTSLSEVTVSAAKPLIRQEDDKMIIDPGPMVSISTNTLEVLESTPGLYVDYEGGIYLTSATPAVVYINGREQKMGNQDIMTLLRSLPPGSVERIEVIRTPSTKYDAASSGGIINVVLKKGVKLGRFGSANIGMNQGEYGNRFGGLSFNNSGEKSSIYINVNYYHNGTVEDLNSVRFLSADTSIHQSARSVQQSDQAYAGYGYSYDIKKDLVFSYDGRLNYTIQNSDAENSNYISDVRNNILMQSENNTENRFGIMGIRQDLGLIKKFDTTESALDTKFSYSFNNNNSTQDYNTVYTFPVSFSLPGEGENLQTRHFAQLQSDLTYIFPSKIKLETGIKLSYQGFISNADYFSGNNGAMTNDSLRTNAFNYIESINSAYAQASYTFGKLFTLKTGVRMEQTFMKGIQTIPVDTSFLINRADFFPYIYISRKLPSIMGIQLWSYIIYRKSITRPGYQNLNPYIKYIDEFLCEAGNPALRPQFTDNIEINISFDDMPVFAIGQNYTSDIFSQVVYQDKEMNNVAVMTYDNLGKNKETYYRGMIGFPPGGAYFFALGGQYNINEYDGFYEGLPLSYTRGSWRFFTFHSLTLFKQTRITLSGFMMRKGQQGFYELNDFGQLNIGIHQTLLGKRLTISLNARDIFRTMLTEFSLNQGSIHTYGNRYADNHRFGINIRYNFGMEKKDERKGLEGFENSEAGE